MEAHLSNTPHELAAEFPADHDILHKLKLHNAHFARLSVRYHEVNGDIHRIETDVEPASDERAEALKKERLHLLDELSAMIAAEKSAA